MSLEAEIEALKRQDRMMKEAFFRIDHNHTLPTDPASVEEMTEGYAPPSTTLSRPPHRPREAAEILAARRAPVFCWSFFN